MSLKRTDTGELARTIDQIQKKNEKQVEDTMNDLVKQALVLSNEKCNGLIEQQNSLVQELTQEVSNLRKENKELVKQLQQQTDEVTTELKNIVRDERNFKAEISRTLKEDLATSANEVPPITKSR